MAVQIYSLKKDGNKQLSAHFQVKEFRCKDGSDVIKINTDLIGVLEKLFLQLNAKAINITSGYRTPSHSVAVGGYSTDQHTKGNAVDIKCKKQDGSLFGSRDITIALEAMNHNGGVGLINKQNAVHVDVRGKKCWFDETNHEKIVNSWYAFWGITKPTAASAEAGLTAYILTCDTLKVRKSASTLSKQVGLYSRGETFYVKQWKGNWCQLKSGNWMCAKKYCRKA